MNQKLLFIITLFIFHTNTLIPQQVHINCKLIAEEKNYFTFVEPPFYFRTTPRENLLHTATINVTYNGFTPEAQTAFQYAVDILETEITSTVAIELVANWTPLGPGILGSAGTTYIIRDFTGAPLSGTWYSAALGNMLAGTDLNTGQHDINANFSSSFSNWYFGTDGNTPANQYDFVSVVLHEIIHGLGFFGSMTVSGAQGSWGYDTDLPVVYDHYAVNGSNQRLLNIVLFPNPSVDLGTQLRSNNIFFDGANSVLGNGGTNPKLYAPATWSQGSSYSHWDEATYLAGNINSLMTYAIGTAEAIHHPGYITRGLLKDIGWIIDQPLPVELSSFTAKVLKGGGVKLDWTTETEVNNYGFNIERATINPESEIRNSQFQMIGFVEGHGNSNSPKEYSFTDHFVNYGSYAYRLKQIDNDGQFNYSNIVEINAGEIPNGLVLEQNFPNPFNPSTKIKFALAESEHAELIVFDMLGNEIIQLFDETAESNKIYEVQFDASGLASGIYFYRFSSGGKMEIRKMLFIK